jgi:hypothetical protein
VIGLRESCLAATEETGRQLWGPARYAAYRTALDAPAPAAASMLEPGVVRFGLGPLTEVVAQRHTFAELAPHLDATLLPVVAQERVLRGEDLRADERAMGAPDDPPLVLHAFEPDYVLPDYRASERSDGQVDDVAVGRPGWGPLEPADVAARPPDEFAGPHVLIRALEDVIAPWAAQSEGEVRIAGTAGGTLLACRAVLDVDAVGPVTCGPIGTPDLLRLVAHAGASGGVHGRRRGGAAGRSLAWWVARCATDLDRVDTVDVDELEFRLEDLDLLGFRTPGEAAWRLELAIGGPEWAVAVAAFDRSAASEDPADDGSGADGAPW